MKKLIAMLLAVALVLTAFSGCGGEETSSTASGSSAASTASTADEDSGEEVSSAAGEDDASSATETTMNTEPIEFTLFVDLPWFWFDSWGTDPVSQKITEITGVSFDMTRATDDQQLGLLIAADDLPDIVYTDNTARIALLCDPDVCYSYNELVEETGVDIHATESEITNNTRADGNYYALLNAYTSQEAIDEGNTLLSGGMKTIAYRTDIWEAIGSPEINTLEDLENALLASKEQFPDVIPLLPDSGYIWYFAEQLGLKGGGNVGYDADGNPCYFLNMEGIEGYFELLNRYAREGLITAESMTYNVDKFREVRNGGHSFMQLRAVDEAMHSNNAAIQAGTDYRWKLLTNDLSDDALVSVNTGIGWAGTFITKKCQDPQRAIEFMSWARSDEGRKLGSWGIQGVHWDYNEDGETINTPEYQQGIAEGKLKQDDFGVGVWIFGDQGDENAFVDHSATDPDQLDVITRLENGVQHTAVMSELYFCIPTEGDMLNIYNSLNDMYTSEVQKVFFATSDEEYEAAVESLYSQAEALGMSELNAWMVEQLAARQG